MASEFDLAVNEEGPLGVRLSYKKRLRLVYLGAWEDVPAKPSVPSSGAIAKPGPFWAAVHALSSGPTPPPFTPVIIFVTCVAAPGLLEAPLIGFSAGALQSSWLVGCSRAYICSNAV